MTNLAPLYLIAWMLGGIGYVLLGMSAKDPYYRRLYWWLGFLTVLFGMIKINASDVLW